MCYSLVTRRHAAVCTRDTCLIPLGLDALPVVVEVFQQRVIALIEDLAAMRGDESHAWRQRQRHIRYTYVTAYSAQMLSIGDTSDSIRDTRAAKAETHMLAVATRIWQTDSASSHSSRPGG